MRLKLLSLTATALLLAATILSCSKAPISQAPVEGEQTGLSTQRPPATVNKTASQQQAEVNLGMAGNFVILSKSGITNVYPSIITGDIGGSPITGAALLVTCAEVAGTIYSVDAAGPLPSSVIDPTRLTTAVGDMETAYTNLAGRPNPNFVNLGAGTIGGLTLSPGLYKWSTDVFIPTAITIAGGPNDIWIFQISKTLTMSSAVKVILSGGAQAKNIYWQVAGAANLGTTSHFEGTIISQTGINLKTGATINGRLLAHTAVTLQQNTVTISK